ncbi:MAG: hypothetical protein AAFO70_04690 [Pseudomonadota bacterium]
MDERIALRRKDFWTAIVMIAVNIFMLAQTTSIPFFRAAAAGVEGRWYNSAALVPYLIFATLLLLSVALLVTAIRQGGAPAPGTVQALRNWLASIAGGRIVAAAVIMLLYIFALIPRVDFTIASALVLLAMIAGFHRQRARSTLIALGFVAAASAYALIVHFPQSEWNAPHDDDWVALACFAALAIVSKFEGRQSGESDGFLRWAPLIAILVPLFLVCVMAFGFRQNVPNRSGLLFQQIEYHYFVNLRPWLQGQQ